jgi:hypothetical protein
MKIETVIAKFLAVREKRAILKKEYEASDFRFKEAQDKIEGYLLEKLNEEGLESFKTATGTAYLSTETKAGCADWPNFWEWLAINKKFDMLEKRVAIKGILTYEEDTGALPPYINKMVERVVRVRRT